MGNYLQIHQKKLKTTEEDKQEHNKLFDLKKHKYSENKNINTVKNKNKYSENKNINTVKNKHGLH